MTKKRNTTAPEAIGAWLGWDINEIREAIYKPTLFSNPSVYTVGEDYACCPAGNRKPPTVDRDGTDAGFVWKPVFEWGGRTVYCSTAEDMAVTGGYVDSPARNLIHEKKALRERGILVEEPLFQPGWTVRKQFSQERLVCKTMAEAVARGWDLAGGKP